MIPVKKKLTSRERGEFKKKREVIERLRSSKIKEEGDDASDDDKLMSDNELESADPETQWQLVQRLDDAMSRYGVTPEIQAAAENVDAMVAAATEKRKRAQQDEEDAIKAAADAEAARKQKAEQDTFRLQTLAMHSEKMEKDPEYRRQMLCVLTQHSMQLGVSNAVDNAAGLRPSDDTKSAQTPSTSRVQAKVEAKEIIDGLKSSGNGNVGIRRSLPEITDADLQDSPDQSNLSWEEKAQEALEMAKRAQVSSASALSATDRLDASRQVTAMIFLPYGMDPRELAEMLLYWFQKGYLSLEYGICWLAARSTPARIGLASEVSYTPAVNALNWCSGSSLRCVLDLPSEIGQQKAQFRDVMTLVKSLFAGVRGPEDKETQLVLCRPHRRSRKTSAEDGEDESDWWSMAFYPQDQKGTSAVCFIRCEYHHGRQWQRYKLDPSVMKLWRIGKSELEETLARQVATYYLFDISIKSDLQQIRTQKSESMKEKDEPDSSPPVPLSLSNAPAVPNAPTPAQATDPWGSYLKNGKSSYSGDSSGKGSKYGSYGKYGKNNVSGDGSFFDSGLKGGKSKGKSKDKKGKPKGKSKSFGFGLAGKGTPWWMH